MSDHTVPQTQDMSPGTSDKSTRGRPRKIRETEATVSPAGEISYEEKIEERFSAIDNMQDYGWAIGEAQTIGKKALEVSHRLFDALTQRKNPPYLIQGSPAVFVYREGTMDRQMKLDALDVEDLIELKAKKARKEAEAKKAEKDKFKQEVDL